MEQIKERQLVAIMFTDIVGYTSLMAADERYAAEVRKRHRQAFNDLHKSHGGEIIQYYGDGTLSVFKSAVAATRCAIEIQKELRKGEPVPLRIGLHLGDIVFDSTEIYGDAVNFASRIESLGIESSILVSAKLNDELKNQSSISTTSLGHYELKNIANPVEVFAVSNDGIAVPHPSQLNVRQKKQSQKTIAVLPFVNLSGGAENEFFCDSITEEVINAISHMQLFQVTSRTSSFVYKNKTITLKQIASELNVAAIVEGSVRRAGNKIRVTAKLVKADVDFHCWAETWEAQYDDPFTLQEEIALRIARKIKKESLSRKSNVAPNHFALLDSVAKRVFNFTKIFQPSRFQPEAVMPFTKAGTMTI